MVGRSGFALQGGVVRRPGVNPKGLAPSLRAGLTERERRVLELRFGLTDGYEHTLEEVGKQYKVTRERIRQIEAKALRKLRHPTRVRQLQGFLETEEMS